MPVTNSHASELFGAYSSDRNKIPQMGDGNSEKLVIVVQSC